MRNEGCWADSCLRMEAGRPTPIGLAYSGCGELEPGSSLLSRGANLERLAAVLLD